MSRVVTFTLTAMSVLLAAARPVQAERCRGWGYFGMAIGGSGAAVSMRLAVPALRKPEPPDHLVALHLGAIALGATLVPLATCAVFVPDADERIPQASYLVGGAVLGMASGGLLAYAIFGDEPDGDDAHSVIDTALPLLAVGGGLLGIGLGYWLYAYVSAPVIVPVVDQATVGLALSFRL